jgi:hypothetical protein
LRGFAIKRNRNLDERRDRVGTLGSEADATTGHVDARDDVVAKGFGADASEIVDLGAATEATIGVGWSDEVGESFETERRWR